MDVTPHSPLPREFDSFFPLTPSMIQKVMNFVWCFVYLVIGVSAETCALDWTSLGFQQSLAFHSGLPRSLSFVSLVHKCLFLGLRTPWEIGLSHLTSIPASLIDVFQSPSPCWGAIVNCLTALKLPSGQCRGARAQLDSPIASTQTQQMTGATPFPAPTNTTAVKLCITGGKNLKKHIITRCNDNDSCSKTSVGS